jgi:hypothetical protein
VLNSTSLNAITDRQFIITHRAVTLARKATKQRIGNGAAGLGNFSSVPRPDWLWGPPSLPHPVVAGVELPRFKADRPRHLLPRLRTCGPYLHLTSVSEHCGKEQGVWFVTQCSSERDRRFGGTHHLNLQGRK